VLLIARQIAEALEAAPEQAVIHRDLKPANVMVRPDGAVKGQRHLDGVLRFVKHPITNGVAEGLDRKIMSIKRNAGGFRNPANFTAAIYFHWGGLDLYPT
jgi:transposase